MVQFLEILLNTLCNWFFDCDYLDLDTNLVLNAVCVLFIFYTLIRCITLIISLIAKFIKGVVS